VGAHYDDTPAGVDAGSAYVFGRSGSSWSQQAQLTAADGAAGDQLGGSVSLSRDGILALVGAGHDDTPTRANVGSAHVFLRSGSNWSQQGKLMAADGAAEDEFGGSVALSGDGNRALVGAPNADTPAGPWAGSAYLFRLPTVTEGENRLAAELLAGGAVRLTYLGQAGLNCALDRTFNLAPPVLWVPQATNPVAPSGVLILTNTPITTTNNFWQMRSIP